MDNRLLNWALLVASGIATALLLVAMNWIAWACYNGLVPDFALLHGKMFTVTQLKAQIASVEGFGADYYKGFIALDMVLPLSYCVLLSQIMRMTAPEKTWWTWLPLLACFVDYGENLTMGLVLLGAPQKTAFWLWTYLVLDYLKWAFVITSIVLAIKGIWQRLSV